ncbi:hypothetical protein [Clostridium sp. Ade.TY]|uniref:hypothetical protein n=1 Tax=Clostridium sp. Ade.TY TaxID=1391647 RepID=UPI000419E4E5|nr:hypothetical protein [Clostridium sp. Ade.TY]
MKRNAIQNVRCSLDELKQAESMLNQATSTVEKTENKKMIEDSLCAVQDTIKKVECTISNYQEH